MIVGATLIVGGALWVLGRAERPLYRVEECWEEYARAATAAESALVDARRVEVTPTVTARDSGKQTAYTCGIWRVQFRGRTELSR